MKSIVIGIMLQEKIRERVLAITRGDYKPKIGEPKIWFTSMKSLATLGGWQGARRAMENAHDE